MKKTFTIDYEVDDRDRPASIQLKTKDICMIKESMSFKTFIAKNKVKSAIERIACELLGGDVHQSTEIDEKMLKRAREIAHKFVDTSAGPWVVQAFRTGATKFVRAVPPKEARGTEHPIFFFPKQTH